MNQYVRVSGRPQELIPAWEVTDDQVSSRYWGENGSAGFAPFMAAFVGVGYAYLFTLFGLREKFQAKVIAAGDGDLLFDFSRDETLDLIREAARHMQIAKAWCNRLMGNPLGAISGRQASQSQVCLEINLRANPFCKIYGRLVDFGTKLRCQRLYLLAALAMTPGVAFTGAELTERMAQLGYDGDGDTSLNVKQAKHRAMDSLRAATKGTGIQVEGLIQSVQINSIPALRLTLDAREVRLDRDASTKVA